MLSAVYGRLFVLCAGLCKLKLLVVLLFFYSMKFSFIQKKKKMRMHQFFVGGERERCNVLEQTGAMELGNTLCS